MSRSGCGRSLLVSMAVTVMLCSGDVYAQDTPAKPPIKASALYLVELKSGRVLLEKDATHRLPPASLTKIMTALVALESAPLQDVVKIDPRALIHPSSLKFHSGEEFLLRDLVAAMLVASANDACEAVAWHVGGDAKHFVTMMNDRARALGLTNTHFANACGFDAPGHYSTAADLAKLTEQALQEPIFAMMVRTVMQDIATVDDKRHIALYNTNELLLDRTVTGVKTGYTSKAGRCLIASTFENGHRVLLVALNVADQWEQAARMLRYGQAVLHVAN
ncbi:MAG TPA: D-alanyl-D-alanine carboxypeptidase family protein [Nitrospiraceae bacterium]|nr:D-alanyl-D-alanine carboxypeptidase family protein [Nitrospiraceae bacterium]